MSFFGALIVFPIVIFGSYFFGGMAVHFWLKPLLDGEYVDAFWNAIGSGMIFPVPQLAIAVTVSVMVGAVGMDDDMVMALSMLWVGTIASVISAKKYIDES